MRDYKVKVAYEVFKEVVVRANDAEEAKDKACEMCAEMSLDTFEQEDGYTQLID